MKWFSWRKRPEETVMSKKFKVQWKVRDGFKPSQRESDGCFELRCPMAMTIYPGVTRTIDLGVSCSCPVHVIPAWESKGKKLVLVDGIWAAQDASPVDNLLVTIRNDSPEPMMLERGDILARCVVLTHQNLDVEYI